MELNIAVGTPREQVRLGVRLRGKLAREAKRLSLHARYRQAGQPILWRGYGWVDLPFTDDGDYQEVAYHLHQRQLLAEELPVLRNLVFPGATVFDIGANLGFFSAMLAGLVGPTGTVLAFEPAPEIFRKLVATVERNGLSQVHPVKLGCGAKQEQMVLRQVTTSSGNASLVGLGPPGETVEIRRLDAIAEARREQPDLIKVDVEGFEPDVLRGAEAIIAESRPILYIEMCGEYERSTRETVNILRDYGYDTRHVENAVWSRVPNGTNFFFGPR